MLLAAVPGFRCPGVQGVLMVNISLALCGPGAYLPGQCARHSCSGR